MTSPKEPSPDKNGRKKDGRFAAGFVANPSGRPPGARGKAALLAEQLIDADCQGIVSKMVSLAKDGDVGAARMLIDRLLPAKKIAQFNLNYSLSRMAQTPARRWLMLFKLLAAANCCQVRRGIIKIN